MTRQEAIENHRKMWNWIADKTEMSGRKVFKTDFFQHQYIDEKELPEYLCYCCEYDAKNAGFCTMCPIDWGTQSKSTSTICRCTESLYGEWLDTRTWQEAARLAREIANLPEWKEALEYDQR